MAVITLPNTPPANGLTFNGKEANDIILSPLYEDPSLAGAMQIRSDIIAKQQMAYSLPMGLSGKAGTCGVVDDGAIQHFEKFLDPKDIKGGFQQCYDDIKNSLYIYTSGAGMNKYENDKNTLFRLVVMYYLRDLFFQNLQRRVWFNDTADVSANADYFNIYDGLWKKIIADADIKVTTIAENALATKSLQLGLASDTAYQTFKSLIENADSRLLATGRAKFMVTRTLFNNYASYLESQPVNDSFSKIENGQLKYYFRNYEVVVNESWDRNIQAYFDNGTTYDKPHRALLLDPQNQTLALDVAEKADNNAFRFFQDPTTDLTHLKWASREDVEFGYSFMISAAY
jgi:hypothetical protein